MKKIINPVICLIAILFFAGCTKAPSTAPASASMPTPVPTSVPDFYRVDGTDVVDSTGQPVQLKGISLGNMLWSSYDPVDNDHSEESFRELSELGFNCVRFYLSYHYFEDEHNPYHYKESGFAWLDQNIAWAKKHNIRLILNMHAPQGGYQSSGEGLALWQDPNNQRRLIALWTEIATRYASEETIIGYGLLNEPTVPLLADIPSTIAQCSSLLQRITDGIRTVDKNHIIFAERLFAIIDTSTGIANWNFTYDDILLPLADENTVYEFHHYPPEATTFPDIVSLESDLLPYLAFRQNYQVPVYLGEFGVYYTAWENNTGASQWVTDMLTLCLTYGIHFNYHAYHDDWFGLYRLPMDDPASKRNETLADIFKTMLK